MEVAPKMNTGNLLAKRRSKRLAMKQTKEGKMEVCNTNTSLGYFQFVPQHVIAIIFDNLSVQDMGIFTLVSKQTRTLFENYLKCKSAKIRFQLHNQHKTDLSTSNESALRIHFKQLGILMKRATCLYQTKRRLQIVIDEIFSLLNCNLYCHHDYLLEDCPCLQFFGIFLHSLTMGWDFSEWLVVLNKVQETSCILGCLHIMFNSMAGSIPHVEMRIRHFYRSVFLIEKKSSYDLAFCLTNILQDKSIRQKTHLIFVLYGPCSARALQYYDMCEVMPPLSPSEMQNRFSELAYVLNSLHLHKLMSNETIFAILRCIKTLPDSWLSLNYTNLLISLDEKLLVSFIAAHAHNGCLSEVGTWIALMAMICAKYVRDMDWIVDVLLTVFKMLHKSVDRFQLMKCVQDAFHAEIAEFHDNSAMELDEEINFNLMLSAFIQFNKCFFKKHLHLGLFKC